MSGKVTSLITAKTISGLLRNLEEASSSASMSHRSDYFRDAVTVIEAMTEALKPFSRQAGEFEGWLPTVILGIVSEVDMEPKEAWFSIDHLRCAHELVKSSTN